MDYLQARFFTPVPGGRPPPIWIVVHDMQMAETGSSAEVCAQWFHTMDVPPERGGSAHYVVDADSEIQCVADGDVAWGAPGANRAGLHFEQPGWANYSTNQWLDDYGRRMIARLANLIRAKCDQYGIPKIFRSATDLKAGLPGITTHYEVTMARLDPSGNHTDPGPGYPMAYLISLVNGTLAPAPPPVYRPKGVFVFDPPLSVKAALPRPKGGAWLMFPDGGIANINAPFRGNVVGRSYFAGRTPDHLELPSTPAELAQAQARGWAADDCYVTVATSGEHYGPVY